MEDAGRLWAFHREIAAVVLWASDLERIKDFVFRDPLTGAYNRHFLNQWVVEVSVHPDNSLFPLSWCSLTSIASPM